MGKFKVGDEVRVVSENNRMGAHEIKLGTAVKLVQREPWADRYGAVAWSVKNDEGNTRYLDEAEIEAVGNTIQLNQPYTSKNGTEWECIAIKDGIAWLSGGGEGDAYRFLLNGENLSQGGGLWDIEWEPVVEWVDTRGTWSEVGVCPQKHHVYNIRFPLIDGKPDFTQATVTPV